MTNGAYMDCGDIGAELKVTLLGDTLDVTLGTGPDHGICDIYVNNTLWGSRDMYTIVEGEITLTITLSGDGPHELRIRNTPNRHANASGHVLSFKQVVTPLMYNLHTVQYTYDAVSRLLAADYYPAGNVNGPAIREYAFAYDVAGNRLNKTLALDGGPPSSTVFTYDDANRIISRNGQAFSYDDAGRLTSDGVNTYEWDRADRMLSAGTVSYAYNGLGHRLSQSAASVVTDFLVDLQPGLAQFLTATTGGNVTRFVTGHQHPVAQQNPDSSWEWFLDDGLGSIRQVVDNSFDPVFSGHYAPYGEPIWGEW